MKKKLLSLLLAITLIIGTLPISAFATQVSGTSYTDSITSGQIFNVGDTINNTTDDSVNISIDHNDITTVADGGLLYQLLQNSIF